MYARVVRFTDVDPDHLAGRLAAAESEGAPVDVPAKQIQFLHDADQRTALVIQLFETACLMAMVDGKSDLQEWNLVMKLCEVFGIDRPEAQTSLNAARERLYKLAEKHNLLPEIMANMEQDEGEAQTEAEHQYRIADENL